jgi:hypothetical protein
MLMKWLLQVSSLMTMILCPTFCQDVEYNPMVESVCAQTEPTTLNDLYAHMLSTEARLDAQNSSQLMTANVATHGGGHGGFG